jgi:hypothetical protein
LPVGANHTTAVVVTSHTPATTATILLERRNFRSHTVATLKGKSDVDSADIAKTLPGHVVAVTSTSIEGGAIIIAQRTDRIRTI